MAGTPLRHWLRPPKHLLVLFLTTTMGFLAGLGWLGWKAIEQDSELDEKRIGERLDVSTDLVAAELLKILTDVELELERYSVAGAGNVAEVIQASSFQLGDDALIAVFDVDAVQAFPRQRLLYYPTLPTAEEPDLWRLAPRRLDAQGMTEAGGAIEYFQVLAQSDDQRTRADALLGLARSQQEAGRRDAALATYSELHHPDVLVGGRPAELLARVARCALLADLNRRAELFEEVGRLDRDLNNGRWQLTSTAYQHYVAEVGSLHARADLPSTAAGPSPVALSLAAGVDEAWQQWQERGPSAQMIPGRISRVYHGRHIFMMWRGTAERRVILVAGPNFIQTRVVDQLRSIHERGVRVGLEDAEGQAVLSPQPTRPQPTSELRRTKTMRDTGLPWMLGVASANPETDRLELSGSSQLVMAGLVFLALFVVAGSYFSVRAMTREIEASRLKSDFVAAVSHEFRTPLTLMRQFSDLLVEDRVSSEQERRRYYAALQRGSRRLTRLVEDLLDFGRMEAGSRVFKFERVVARDWLQSIVTEFQDEIRSKGYTVEVSWTGSTQTVVQADEGAIGRALWNLLDNAVKYSPTCRTVWVTGEVGGGRFTVRVRDGGPGIPVGEQRAIFRRFVRGSATNSQIKGTGLGLALVEQIVEAHGGQVHLDSVVGEGSTFTITLPAASEEREQTKWRAS
jgi:signal transduction histidine kinase